VPFASQSGICASAKAGDVLFSNSFTTVISVSFEELPWLAEDQALPEPSPSKHQYWLATFQPQTKRLHGWDPMIEQKDIFCELTH
jgi:hypothetical protein